ncbi:unnamed protein product [Dovyalis caffra]|uniref:Uncharacterized protein n=1 Tax=Dovyalis caffra TaxID=77055 RepID=A0AAV1SSN8_9ROSI|nr:unnamed protein product [Dovyalis caffra]
MAVNSPRSILVSLLILAMVLSPLLPSQAAGHKTSPGFGPPAGGSSTNSKLICAGCVCSGPSPPGPCSKCCASP